MSLNVPGAAPLKRRTDLSTRAAAGAAAITLALVCLWVGGFAFWLLTAAAAMLMLAEWSGLMRASPGRIVMALALFAIPLVIASPEVDGTNGLALPILGCVALLVALLGGSLRLGLGLLYAGLPALALLLLRDRDGGIALTLWTLAVVWATDIGAYFAGRRIGGPKLAPRLSPNKTWAGLGGGVVSALVIGAIIARVFGLDPLLLLLGAPLAVLAQLGDLFESWLKRRAGVKDSGRLLPGHGGALDRLDGVVPVAIVVALLAFTGVI